MKIFSCPIRRVWNYIITLKLTFLQSEISTQFYPHFSKSSLSTRHYKFSIEIMYTLSPQLASFLSSFVHHPDKPQARLQSNPIHKPPTRQPVAYVRYSSKSWHPASKNRYLTPHHQPLFTRIGRCVQWHPKRNGNSGEKKEQNNETITDFLSNKGTMMPVKHHLITRRLSHWTLCQFSHTHHEKKQISPTTTYSSLALHYFAHIMHLALFLLI